MEVLQLLAVVKDPGTVAVLLWTIMELRRVRGHLSKLHSAREDHDGRLHRLEARAGIP